MPMSIFEFLEIFNTEEKCLQFFLEEGIVYQQLLCTECATTMSIVMKYNEHYYRCHKGGCKAIKSLFYGTILYNSKLDSPKVMMIAFLWLKKASMSLIVNITGISDKTVKTYVDQLVGIIACSLDEQDTMIGGEGIEVQLDESKFGKRKYNRGHPVEGVWVLGVSK
jgi:hypothetical protein